MNGENVVFSLSGTMNGDQVTDLSGLLAGEPNRRVHLDLTNVTLVNHDAVVFLARAEAEGVHGLKRALSAFDLVMLGIGAVIGAGIFSAIGTAAVGEIAPDGTVTRYGAGPALVLSFVLLGGVCALAGLCYSELTAMIRAFAGNP